MSEQLPEDRIQEASSSIAHAFKGENRVIDTDRKRIYHKLRWVKIINLTIYMGLSFFEIPSWCDGLSKNNKCARTLSDGTVVYPPWSNLPKMPQRVAHSFEIVCLIGFLMTIYYRLTYVKKSTTAKVRTGILTFLIVTALTDNIRILIMNDRMYFSQYCRGLIFIIILRSVRECASRIYSVMKDATPVLILIIGHILFFSWMGTVLFENSLEGSNYFANLPSACWYMLVLLTTSNYPDVMMPAYAQNRWYFIFFMFYLLLGLFFLLNLVLAVYYNNYRNQIEKAAQKFVKNRQEMLQQAYKILDPLGEGYVAVEDVAAVLPIVCYKIGIRKSKGEELLNSLHQTDTITIEELDQLMNMLSLCNKKRTPNPHLFKRCCPRQYSKDGFFHKLQHVLKSDCYKNTMDVFTATILIFLIFEMSFASTDITWVVALQFIYLAVYYVEMLAKVLAFGFCGYIRSLSNFFDLFVNVLSLILIIVALMSSSIYKYNMLMNYFILLRVLRLIKLLFRFKQYSIISNTFLSLLPIFGALMGILIATFYIFDVIGISLYGGEIYSENPKIYSDSTVPSTYVFVNFNDFPSGLITLFALMIVNNWWVVTEMYTDVTSTYYRWYFIAFYFFIVIVGLNLMVAFVIDMFSNQWERAREKDLQNEAIRNSIEPDLQPKQPMRNLRASLTSGEVMNRWMKNSGSYE